MQPPPPPVVLLVDPEVDRAARTADTIAGPFQVERVSTGAQALARVREAPVRVVMIESDPLDMLPGELARRIRLATQRESRPRTVVCGESRYPTAAFHDCDAYIAQEGALGTAIAAFTVRLLAAA
jgi:PleD family two-component response regulator